MSKLTALQEQLERIKLIHQGANLVFQVVREKILVIEADFNTVKNQIDEELKNSVVPKAKEIPNEGSTEGGETPEAPALVKA